MSGAAPGRRRVSRDFAARDRGLVAETCCHEDADLVPIGRPPVDDRHDLPAIHDGDPVTQLEDLVELGRDEQHGRTRIPLLDRLAMDELDAADVEPARGLVEDEETEVAVELPGDDDLLLVAAGQRPGKHVR